MAHEYAHARTALWQGDDTGYALGRVTLNPLPHIDPWMTLLLPALLWFMSGGSFLFGGARPVPITPRKFRHYVQGDLIVSSAGVITNIGLAILCALLFMGLGAFASFVPAVSDGLAIFQRMLLLGIRLNLILAVFNLIPIPPLDGSHLLYHALPPSAGARYRSIGQFGFLPLFVLLMFFPAVISFLMTPAAWGFQHLYDVVSPFGIGDLWDFTRG
ncbi:MAG TPA: site-2 protease family protein [Gemmatimonadales bacterium]|nr:site-2 protease family protein [Gemmatimonadales bacterium]